MSNDKEIPYGYCHCGCGSKTNLNKYNWVERGLIKGEPRKFIKGHHRKNNGLCAKCGVNHRYKPPNGRLQSYCNTCKNENYKSRKRKYTYKYENECIICKTKFHSAWVKALYCSNNCKHRAAIIRQNNRIRVCEYCHEQFLPCYSSRYKKYCSHTCANKAQNKIWEDKKIKLNCKYCGKEFIKRTKNQKYCSKECNWEFNRLIHREKYAKNYKKEYECPTCKVRFSALRCHKSVMYCSTKCKKEIETSQRKNSRKRLSTNLTDGYIKDILVHRTILRVADIPDTLIEVYRKYIKLKRLLKSGGNKDVKCERNSGSIVNTSQSPRNG